MARSFDFERNAWIEDPSEPLVRREPVLPVAPGQWHFPAEARPKQLDWAIAGFAAASTIFLGGMATSHDEVRTLGVLLLAGTGLWTSRIEASRHRSLPGSTYLLEDPEDLNVCLVDIRIVRAHRVVGRDRGAAWFESGVLHYSGHRTSFVLGDEQVLPKSEWRVFLDPESGLGLPEYAVPLRFDHLGTYVAFSCPGHGDRPASISQELRFMRKLRGFRNDPQPSYGPRQWPPLEP